MVASNDRYKNVRKCLDEPDPAKRDACLAEATIEHLESIRSLNEKMMDGISSLHGDIVDFKNEMADGLDSIGTSIMALEAVSGVLLTRTRILDNRTKKMAAKIDTIESRVGSIESSMATKDDVNAIKRDMVTKDDLKQFATKDDLKNIDTKLDNRFNEIKELLGKP